MTARRRPSLKADEAQAIREEVDAALVVIARKHFLTVGYLLRLAALGGSVQA